MISASYELVICDRCRGDRYIHSLFDYSSPVERVAESWHSVKDRVLISAYIKGYSGRCRGCRLVGQRYTLVMLSLVCKLGVLR